MPSIQSCSIPIIKAEGKKEEPMKENKKSLKPELTSSKEQAVNWHTPFLVSLTFNYEKSF